MLKVIVKILRIVVVGLAIYVVYLLISNLLLPVFHKEVSKEYQQKQYESKQTDSERILCIDDNEHALVWRLRMIASAQERIVLATFDLRTDRSGTDVIAALYDAAQRNVHIQILIDGSCEPIFLRHSDAFHALVSHEKVELKVYNPINLHNLDDLNYRMHDKYILVDDRMYLLGGRNTTDIFLGALNDRSNIDREILVYRENAGKGESFQQLEEYFNQIWNGDFVQGVCYTPNESVVKKEYEGFQNRYRALLEKYGDFRQYDEWHDNTFEPKQITLISNETLASSKEPRVLYAIEQLSLDADEVIIQTPYVICNEYMYSALENIARGAELKLFINAVEKGSNPWGCTDYLNNKNKVLNTGAEIYELMNEYAVHTKTILIDHDISIIGSYNLDMRSTFLDTELMLVVDSEQLNGYIRDQLEQCEQKSLKVSPDGTETKGSLYQKQSLTTAKSAFYGFLRIIIRPFRHLL